MKKLDIINWKKESIGQCELDPAVFDIEVKNEVLHEVTQWQLASRRQGTHMTKTRGLVSGGGKKPFKQKGTGNARQGSSRSPLMPGGGKLFGPVPRDYSYSLPKKMRALGLKMALSYLSNEGRILVLDKMTSKEGKSKELVQNLKNIGVAKAFLVDSEVSENFLRASNNLKNFKYVPVEGVNVFDLLKYDQLVVTEASIKKLSERCLSQGIRK